MQTKKHFLLLFLLFSPFIIFAHTQVYKNKKISAYTEYFISESKELKKDSTKRLRSKREIKEGRIPQKEISAYIELNENSDINQLKSSGITINSVFDKIVTAVIPLETIEELASLEQIKRIEMGVPVKARMDAARASSHVNQAHEKLINKTGYSGKGVIIGIIDAGFDYRHLNFKDKEGKLRIKRVWNQNSSHHGTKPQNFSYGREYNTEEEILQRKYDDLYSGTTHGTHVLGIASGSDKTNENLFYGVAPEAEIVLVSIKDDKLEERISNVSISDAIKYIFDYADTVNKACVINLSLGSHFGPHDGSSTFDILSDMMQGEGRLLVGAAGNEAENNYHVSKNILSKQDTLKTLFDLPAYQYSNDINIVEIWGEENKSFSVQLFCYDKLSKKSEDISEPIAVTAADTKSISINSNGFEGQIDLYPSVNKNNRNNRYSLLLISKLKEISSNQLVGMKIFDTDGTVHAWFAENGSFTNINHPGWSNINKEYSIGEIGGTGKRIISVGAYVSKNNFKNLSETTEYFNGKKEDIAYFSSVGPSLDGRMKPEITAPGATIISSYSGHKEVLSSKENIIVKKTTVGSYNYYYGAMNGTSMSSPHVAGILALWLEANNKLSPEDVRKILKKTARKDRYTGENENNQWGYGKIDAYKGLLEISRLTDSKKEIGIEFNFFDKSSRTLEIKKTKKDLGTIEIKIWTVEGKAVLEKKIHSENMETIPIHLPSLGLGVYIVKIRAKGMKDFVFKIMV